MRYRFIRAEKGNYALWLLCRVLRVSPSGYYAWQSRRPSERSQENQKLKRQVLEIYEQSRKTYGSRRIQHELAEQGQSLGRSRVRRLMKEAGVQWKKPRSWRPKTTDSRHSFPVADNLLEQAFTVDGPGKVWMTDITYVPTAQGFVYLAVVMDLYSRRIIGHAMSSSLHRQVCLEAFELACGRGVRMPGLIHHSDRGSQYASQEYRGRLRNLYIQCSMSGKGNCYDNAVAESFFATLEKELLSRVRFQNHRDAKRAIFEYIEVFYNRLRRHSSIEYLSPINYEKQFAQNQKAA